MKAEIYAFSEKSFKKFTQTFDNIFYRIIEYWRSFFNHRNYRTQTHFAHKKQDQERWYNLLDGSFKML